MGGAQRTRTGQAAHVADQTLDVVSLCIWPQSFYLFTRLDIGATAWLGHAFSGCLLVSLLSPLNVKDVGFFTAFIIGLYFCFIFIERPNLRRSVLVGRTFGLCGRSTYLGWSIHALCVRIQPIKSDTERNLSKVTRTDPHGCHRNIILSFHLYFSIQLPGPIH